MRRDVRILVLGDDGTGKSTLIMSLIKETFIPNVQHVVPEVTIPPEITPENVTTYIVDSSARPENRDHLENEIRRAHVICVVYAIDDMRTFDRIPQHWLPYIRSLGVSVPVVLVGNKIDLRGNDVTNQSLEDDIIPIMNEFKEVETCVECSSRQPLNVSEVFYFAQKAVLHPTAPLYDARDHALKPTCMEALRRIFKLCDQDKDGVLNDMELNEFQRKCFNAPLQQQELEGVKDVVREYNQDGVNEYGLTEAGFIYLHTLFIQKGRLETTWTVLRRFGYGDDLVLDEGFLYPAMDIPPQCSLELSHNGYQFLTELFQACDKDRDGALNERELIELFSTTPGNPWATVGFPESTITNEAGWVTLQGFLAQWSLMTLLDHRTTLAYLAYLGYNGDTREAFKITRPRKAERRRGRVQRSVLLCYVLGPAGAGKRSLLRTFVGKPMLPGYTPTTRPLSTVNTVEIKGSERYLVLQEVGSKYQEELLLDKRKLDMCDLLCFVYDASDANSFEYVANLRREHDLDDIPTVFVATKCDLDPVQQRFDVPPDVYCRNLGLAPPLSISVATHRTADIFSVLASIAMNPYVGG
ncbi:EF hand associated-domain-containing protein [Thamnocephalis sphaerospora]|uniref:Mitochondrial Rho GTPase n=1 Tax=Thamnocephalis sphaerospora TaxID=78915 RepID=A0A4P9XMD4_9FUNG|nr:EF hand associated-domain-containing protein [Thamnocephalis sphaerospora]|eukprot:RKP07064.1 EF hand associated-domain-containing protein [Thamnocephalis sphaerospora]